MADQLARKLKYQRMYDDAIHGDKNQDERDRVLANFKSNRVNIFFSFFFFQQLTVFFLGCWCTICQEVALLLVFFLLF